jgi:hypothetical protein
MSFTMISLQGSSNSRKDLSNVWEEARSEICRMQVGLLLSELGCPVCVRLHMRVYSILVGSQSVWKQFLLIFAVPAHIC